MQAPNDLNAEFANYCSRVLQPDSAFAEYANEISSGRGLWEGPDPDPALTPSEVIALTLFALRHNDEPEPHTGAATLRRFSTPDFVLAGMPTAPWAPQALSALLTSPASQYNLLLQDYELSLPSDTVFADERHCFQEVQIDALGGGPMLAKLGWELERSEAPEQRGCWLTCSVAWQDFRDGFRPGIGREEWTRAYG